MHSKWQMTIDEGPLVTHTRSSPLISNKATQTVRTPSSQRSQPTTDTTPLQWGAAASGLNAQRVGCRRSGAQPCEQFDPASILRSALKTTTALYRCDPAAPAPMDMASTCLALHTDLHGHGHRFCWRRDEACNSKIYRSVRMLRESLVRARVTYAAMFLQV
jgi:hypothetical protein